MGGTNRYPVTIRFNQEDQIKLAQLTRFYGNVSEKELLKMAFMQLYIATQQLEKKIAAEEKQDEVYESNDSGSTDDVPATNPGSNDSASSASSSSEPTGTTDPEGHGVVEPQP